MLRRFLRDSVIYSASATRSRGVAILLVPLYTRFLQPAEYGALDLLMVFATVANYLVALEISQGLARVYAEAKTPGDKQAYVSSALWFAATAYALFVAVALPFAAPIAGWLLDSRSWQGAAQAMILAVGANGVFFLLQDLLRWQLQPLRHALVSLTYTLVSTAVGAGMVVYADAGVPGILYGQCAGAAAGLAAAWAGGAAAHWRLTFGLAHWREMLSYSAPQVLSSIAGYFALYFDRVLIKEFMTLDDVGIYGIGARFAAIVSLLMMGFQSALVPLVFQHHAAPETPAQLARVFRYFLALALPALLLLCGFSRELVWLFTTPQYYGAAAVVPLLAAAVLLANMYIFTLGVFIARRTSIVLAINLAAVLINVAGSYLLIPAFGMLGAAAATLLSGLSAFLLYVYCNRQFYPIPFEWGRILAAALLGAVLAAVLFGLPQDRWPLAAAMSVKLAVCAAGGLAIAVILVGRAELLNATRRWSGRTAP